MKRSAAWLSVLALFVSGVSIGALGLHLYYFSSDKGELGSAGRPPGPPPAAFGADLFGELELTPEQAERIDEIRGEARREGEAIRRELRPRLDSLMQRSRQRISEVLTEEQRVRFERLSSEHRHRFDRFFLGEGPRGRWGRPRRGPGPHRPPDGPGEPSP